MVRMRTGRWIVAATVLAALAVAGPGAGTPPCPPVPDYEVSYDAPVWNVTILDSARISLATVWYRDSRNGSYRLQPLADHVGRPPRAEEPVTLQDTDGDGNLSASDVLGVWDPDARLRNLELDYGVNASAIGANGWITLEDGHRYVCGGEPDGSMAFALLVGASTAAVILFTGFGLSVVLRRRSRPPGGPR